MASVVLSYLLGKGRLDVKNYAFIDGNNLYLGLNWRIDYARFYEYLKRKYGVVKGYYFIGYIQDNEPLYQDLKRAGFDLVFKTVVKQNGVFKGNCDSELVLQAMIDLANYDRAVLVTSDGDFACLAKHLDGLNKLEAVLSPSNRCSYLLRKEVPGKIAFMSNLRAKLEYKKKGKRTIRSDLSRAFSIVMLQI